MQPKGSALAEPPLTVVEWPTDRQGVVWIHAACDSIWLANGSITHRPLYNMMRNKLVEATQSHSQMLTINHNYVNGKLESYKL